MTTHSAKATARLSGDRVLILFLLFFGTIFAVNGVLVVAALTTNTGVVAVEPYRKGLAYNTRIAAGERQTQLGWNMSATATREGDATIVLTDHAKQPVTGLWLHAVFGRPSTERFDRHLNFVEEAPGRYRAAMPPLAAGNWLVTIEARATLEPDTVIYRDRRRLWLAP